MNEFIQLQTFIRLSDLSFDDQEFFINFFQQKDEKDLVSLLRSLHENPETLYKLNEEIRQSGGSSL